MMSVYGATQVYLVQPTKLDFEISNSDPIKLCYEGRFRTYCTADERGFHSEIKLQLNRRQAEMFANHNRLILIDDYQSEKLQKIPLWQWKLSKVVR